MVMPSEELKAVHLAIKNNTRRPVDFDLAKNILRGHITNFSVHIEQPGATALSVLRFCPHLAETIALAVQTYDPAAIAPIVRQYTALRVALNAQLTAYDAANTAGLTLHHAFHESSRA